MNMEEEEEEDLFSTATEIVNTLTSVGAKLVCVDFDATFLRIHTGGTWQKSASELCPHVRSLFLVLIPLICDANIHVAVVTFSPQVMLIKEVLFLCFGQEIAQNLIVRGDDSSWTLHYPDVVDFLPIWDENQIPLARQYKLPYIISAALEAAGRRCESILNTDTVLIDDDPKNIRDANDNGIAGIYFEPQQENFKELCHRIKKLQVKPLDVVMHTPMKCKANAPHRIMATPEAGNNNSFSNSMDTMNSGCVRRKKFSFCTPSPVMKLKYSVDMGRPKPKRTAKLRNCTRNIEEDLHELHLAHAQGTLNI
jgi:hypothetical protein